MASGDESRWPRQGLACHEFSLASGKNAQLCHIYWCLLRKHVTRKCIQNAAKPLKTLCSPTLLSSPPPVCSSPPHTSSLRLKAAPYSPHLPLPPLRLRVSLPAPLLSSGLPLSLTESLCLSTQTGLPAPLLLVPVTPVPQEQVLFKERKEPGCILIPPAVSKVKGSE